MQTRELEKLEQDKYKTTREEKLNIAEQHFISQQEAELSALLKKMERDSNELKK